MNTTIARFEGHYRWLSNFAPAVVTHQGITFPTVENAYQAAKCADRRAMAPFVVCTASQSKRLGRKVEIRSDWLDVKLGIMHKLLRQKFEHQHHQTALIATRDWDIVEGNYWHDNFWGDCSCIRCKYNPGQNHLGKLIMQLRDHFNSQP